MSCTTKNYSRGEAEVQLRQLLQLPWTSASLITSDGAQTAVQITKKGRAIVQRSSSSSSSISSSSSGGGGGGDGGGERAAAAALPRHDRAKSLPIPGDAPDPFLMKIGLQTEDGRVRAAMQDKFMQARGDWGLGWGGGRRESDARPVPGPCQAHARCTHEQRAPCCPPLR